MREVKVKICGITNGRDALISCENGADMLGFVFVPESPRCLEISSVMEIAAAVRSEYPEVLKVALFRDAEPGKVKDVVRAGGFECVQLHGLETPDYCEKLRSDLGVKVLKTFKVRDNILSNGSYMPGDYASADLFVFDTFHRGLSGGTGLTFDWEILSERRDIIPAPFLLAGGLVPENVEAAVKAVRPYGVDSSSGVEAYPGKKDPQKIKEFIENAKKI
ncbi:MAG: N-(5'-phosphoribosyl)anthranilate isomerase [Candidatus Omnitrophica bacterium]|nr:N-(5'-phosphoribosyl)anthranilate isomerase [Candidatus Omnitrophota bacterium]